MREQGVSLKTVYQLRVDDSDKPIRYRVAAYQRGYRWMPQQVTQLLDDIREFTQRGKPEPQDFYCLQPLVLKPNTDGAFEVVDGQQRLTTLLLVLRHFNERAAARFQQKLYTLEYETRDDLLKFLENPSPEQAASNVDYFHIAQAITTIEDWSAKRENEVDSIKIAFLNQVKVIWFLLSPAENAAEAFTRLNVGKIPLTNDELIRALFLRGKPHDQEEAARRLRIANEWDHLEKGLQRSHFWYFLSNASEQSGNRIGFLFDLVARAEGMEASADQYTTFYHYSDRLIGKEHNTGQEWLSIKQRYMLLEEWFEDRHLYHLVGFLIWEKTDLNELIALASNATKKDFKHTLRAWIYSGTIGEDELADLDSDQVRERIADRLDDLEYGPNSQKIRSLLLLFNLATLLQSSKSNMRFQFDSFKTEEWHIEHVRSVAPDSLGGRNARIEWLKNCLSHFASAGEEQDLQSEMQQFLELPPTEATDVIFELLYEKVLSAFQEPTSEPDHSVANLVLLDRATNMSYKNAPFAVKRGRVLSLDRDGIFVPLCTRNVFLKVYNARVEHTLFWTPEDKQGYRQALIDVLHTFFLGAWIDE